MYEHAPTIRRFLHGRVDRSLLEDATQETFVRAWSRRDTLSDENKLVPWLLGIARLVSCEHARARRRFLERFDTVETEIEDETANPEATVMGRETEEAVADALRTLDEPRRRALMMRVNGGRSYDEIAKSMGWSLAKVKNEIHRGRRQLRALLAVSLSLVALVIVIGRPVAPDSEALEKYAGHEEAWCVGTIAERSVPAAELACVEVEPTPPFEEGPLCR